MFKVGDRVLRIAGSDLDLPDEGMFHGRIYTVIQDAGYSIKVDNGYTGWYSAKYFKRVAKKKTNKVSLP